MNQFEALAMAKHAASVGIRMTFSTTTQRKKPRAGDRRATKKHGEQVRIFMKHDGMYVVRNGRNLYEWVSITDPRAAQYAMRTP